MAKSEARTRRDRWADWFAVGVVAVAVLVGWGLMLWVGAQTETFADEGLGVTVQYPRDWLMKESDNLVLQVMDPDSGLFKTQYQVRAWPIDATASLTPTLTVVLNNASLSRAQKATAYRLFDIVQGKDIGDGPSMESSYAYVAESGDLFSERMPVVVQGKDVAIARGEFAYVFTLLAPGEAFAGAEAQFLRFIEATEFD